MILITGGFGYLGGRIAEYLVKSGYDIRIGTHRVDPIIPEVLSKCEVVLIDLLDKISLETACKNISIIIHAAALNASECQQEPENALLINGLGTLKLLRAAEKEKVKKFLYLSTAHVYGAPLQGNIDETSLPDPSHPYSITHQTAENFVLESHRRGTLSGIVCRLTNAVGCPVNSDANCWMLVVNDVCKQTVEFNRIVLHSNKLVERDYVPISSVCSSIGFLLNSNILFVGIVNISSGITQTLLDLTILISERAEKILDLNPTVEFSIDSNIEQPQHLLISNRKLVNAGVTISTDISREIDELLLNCSQWFAK